MDKLIPHKLCIHKGNGKLVVKFFPSKRKAYLYLCHYRKASTVNAEQDIDFLPMTPEDISSNPNMEDLVMDDTSTKKQVVKEERMSLEDKIRLKVIDCSGRIPYGLKFCRVGFDGETYGGEVAKGIIGNNLLTEVYDYERGEGTKIYYHGLDINSPCLRSMDSMTPDETKEHQMLLDEGNVQKLTDFYNSHFLDFRGLSKLELAVLVSKDMYNF